MNNEPNRPNTPDEMIEVIKAFKEGKKLEVRSARAIPPSGWSACGLPAYNFGTFQYRVVREPREFWLYGGKLLYTAEAARGVSFPENVIHVREVLK